MISDNHGVKIRHRLIAIFYDVLIVFFITVVTTFIIQQIMISSGLVPLQDVQISETETIKVIPPNSFSILFLKSLWLIVSFLYFAYYWSTRGQTPGMRVWKMKLQNQNGTLISWPQAFSRYVGAIFGLGLVWMIFNPDRLALQDILSKSVLIKV